MPKKLVLVPYKQKSRSTKALANLLGKKVDHRVWRVIASRVRNRVPFVFPRGTDKVEQFRRFQDVGVSIPGFTTERATAAAWITNGSTVVCRTITNGSEGRGIVIAETTDQLVDAPLYTKYFKKKKEFRVHVLNGEVIDIQEKRKRKGANTNAKVRNLANGYVFCRDGIVVPNGLAALAIKATGALSYPLGGVDIAYNEHHNHLVVLEVNACPGMVGSTLESYANGIAAWYKGQINAV